MKITIFTSNQPRHISLIESLADIADEVFAIQECNTVFTGEVDDFFRRSEVMQAYFRRVIEAEQTTFGRPRFGPDNVYHMALKLGDLNRLEMEALGPALASDVYVVFGSSYIKGDLCDFLVANRALNVHMGTSPYYRGSSCNFWAMYDGRPDYVGATIHLLSAGLDSGAMLFHALPAAQEAEPFLLGMLAVRAAHLGLVHYLRDRAIWDLEPIVQDKGVEMRYSRNREFTDAIAADYLDNLPTASAVCKSLQSRDASAFLNPYTA